MMTYRKNCSTLLEGFFRCFSLPLPEVYLGPYQKPDEDFGKNS